MGWSREPGNSSTKGITLCLKVPNSLPDSYRVWGAPVCQFIWCPAPTRGGCRPPDREQNSGAEIPISQALEAAPERLS